MWERQRLCREGWTPRSRSQSTLTQQLQAAATGRHSRAHALDFSRNAVPAPAPLSPQAGWNWPADNLTSGPFHNGNAVKTSNQIAIISHQKKPTFLRLNKPHPISEATTTSQDVCKKQALIDCAVPLRCILDNTPAFCLRLTSHHGFHSHPLRSSRALRCPLPTARQALVPADRGINQQVTSQLHCSFLLRGH